MIRIIALFVVISVSLHAEPLRFHGYAQMSDGRVLIALFDTEQKVALPWLRVGQVWRGLSVASLDLKTQTLEVRFAGECHMLHLYSAIPGETMMLPSLENGTFVLADGTTVCGSEIVLTMGGAKLSSPAGVMITNGSRSAVSGDLLIQMGDAVFSTSQANVRIVDGKLSVVAESLRVQPKKRPGL